MAKKPPSAVGMASRGVAHVPSKGQQSFNALVGKIEERRAALAGWEAFDPDFRRKYNDEYVPLRHGFDEVRTRLVHRLDQSHDLKGLAKSDRQAIAELISHIAGDLLASADEPGIAEVYRRYNASEAAAGTPDIDMVQEQMDRQEERERIRREAREAYHANRKKARKGRPAGERARADQADVHQSIREVYRKLASVLHPDREVDPVEQLRKAALMQRVNQAYASRSLLDLLEIQLELEHIDQASLDNISEDRLRRWNTVLNDQLLGLEQELVEIEEGYRGRFGLDPALAVSPRTVRRALVTSITHLREAVRAFEHDLRSFDDIDRLKLWLKSMKREISGDG